MKKPYFEAIPALRDVDLENSWLIDFTESATSIRMTIEAVLSKRHPLYHPPVDGEALCYRDAVLVFDGITSTAWSNKVFAKNTGPGGEVDYGNIDSFYQDEDGWCIGGEWGRLRVACETVTFRLV